MDNNEAFRRLEEKYLAGQSLAVDEELIARSFLQEDFRKSCIACGAILRNEASSPDAIRDASIKLAELCQSAVTDDHPEKNEILIALLLIPLDRFNGITHCIAFIYSGMSASGFTTRANTLLVLERLARLGDATAYELINRGLQDKHEVVRRNAEICMARLNKSG